MKITSAMTLDARIFIFEGILSQNQNQNQFYFRGRFKSLKQLWATIAVVS